MTGERLVHNGYILFGHADRVQTTDAYFEHETHEFTVLLQYAVPVYPSE